MSKTYAVVPAAGRGLRMGADKPKQFLELAGKPILSHTLDMLSDSGLLAGIFLVVPADFLIQTEALVQTYCAGSASKFFHRLSQEDQNEGETLSQYGNGLSISVVAGGAERQDSVYNALSLLPADCQWVMIHDGVRPFTSLKVLQDTREAAFTTGAAIAAMASTDTVKRVEGEQVRETLPREQIWLVQTPQIFRKEIILRAYDEARLHGWVGTDDASFVERMGAPVAVVRGERSNIKVTTREDLAWAAWFLAEKHTTANERKSAAPGGAK